MQQARKPNLRLATAFARGSCIGERAAGGFVLVQQLPPPKKPLLPLSHLYRTLSPTAAAVSVGARNVWCVVCVWVVVVVGGGRSDTKQSERVVKTATKGMRLKRERERKSRIQERRIRAEERSSSDVCSSHHIKEHARKQKSERRPQTTEAPPPLSPPHAHTRAQRRPRLPCVEK